MITLCTGGEPRLRRGDLSEGTALEQAVREPRPESVCGTRTSEPRAAAGPWKRQAGLAAPSLSGGAVRGGPR